MTNETEIDYSNPGSVKDIRARFKQTDYTRDIACPKKYVLNQKPAPAAKPIKPNVQPKPNKFKHNVNLKGSNFSGQTINHYLQVQSASSSSIETSPKSQISPQQEIINLSKSPNASSSQTASFSSSSILKIQSDVDKLTISAPKISPHSPSTSGNVSGSVCESSASLQALPENSVVNLTGDSRVRIESTASSLNPKSVRKSVSDMFDDAIKTATSSQLIQEQTITAPLLIKTNSSDLNETFSPNSNLSNLNHSQNSNSTNSSNPPVQNNPMTPASLTSSLSGTTSNSVNAGSARHDKVYQPPKSKNYQFMKKPRHLSDNGLGSYCGNLQNDAIILNLIGECEDFIKNL